MNTQEKISTLIADEWNNYKGKFYQEILLQHAEMRKEVGDDMFLLYLEQQKAINPKPKFKLPEIKSDSTAKEKSINLLSSLGIDNPSEEQVNIAWGFIVKIDRDAYNEGFRSGQEATNMALYALNQLFLKP